MADASNGRGWKRRVAAAGVAFVLAPAGLAAQPDASSPSWSIAGQAYFYLQPGDEFLLPILTADRGALHLEARWNYEDRDTFSTWAGWTFAFGTAVQLALCPMLGAIAGQTDGIAPGLELEVAWRRLALYSENEHVLGFAGSEESYFYSWTQLDVALTSGWKVGLALQRTRLYDSEYEVSRGPYVAHEEGRTTISLYGFDLGSEGAFAIAGLGIRF